MRFRESVGRSADDRESFPCALVAWICADVLGHAVPAGKIRGVGGQPRWVLAIDATRIAVAFALVRILVKLRGARRPVEIDSANETCRRGQATAFLMSPLILASAAASSEVMFHTTGCIWAPSSCAGFSASPKPNAMKSLPVLM